MIEISNLTKKFKDFSALKDISLSIDRGELFGLVGPDGAGKTTLLRILAGLLVINEGKVTIADIDLGSSAESVKPKIGYMAQEFSLYEKLSVLENLHFFAEMYDVHPETQEERLPVLLDFAGLTAFTDRRAAHLSGGMKKKLALASTLVHRPPLLLLDEPTTGVDPVSRREFWKILNELHLNGTTIVVSTPYMDEADRCSRVGLMHQGELVICDTPRAIRNNLKGEIIKIITDDWRSAQAALENYPGVLEIQTYGEALHVVVDSSQDMKFEITRFLEKNKVHINDIRLSPPRMEEAFISLVKGIRG